MVFAELDEVAGTVVDGCNVEGSVADCGDNGSGEEGAGVDNSDDCSRVRGSGDASHDDVSGEASRDDRSRRSGSGDDISNFNGFDFNVAALWGSFLVFIFATGATIKGGVVAGGIADCIVV